MSVSSAHPAARAAPRLRPGWILLGAWLVGLAYAWPGYMNWDSGEQLFQARQHEVVDWHPPIMAAYWRVIELVVTGPAGMLLLQSALFLWGLAAILRTRFAPRRAAVLAACLFLFPPILTPMAVVWKDAQMAAFLLGGLVLALDPRRGRRALGIALLVLAAGVRDNGVAALPPLCLLFVGDWRVRPRVIVAGALTVAIAVAAMLANRAFTDKRIYPWYKTVAIHDIAGTICNAGPMSDDEIRRVLDGVVLKPTAELQRAICAAYTPRVWFDLSFGERAVFTPLPEKPDRLARRRAWWDLIVDHPGAYLTHRLDVMAEVLGLTHEPLWEPVCQSFAANDDHLKRISHDASLSFLQKKLGWLFRAMSHRVFFRPWAYALLSLLLLGDALRRRDRVVVALVGSGLLYELSYAIAGAAPDYRYSHWMVTCCCLGLVFAFATRWRAARPIGTPPHDDRSDRGDDPIS